MTPAPPAQDLEALRLRWMAAWPDALAAWSKFTRLRAPRLCLTAQEAQANGLTGSFAAIRLVDQTIMVSLPGVLESGLEDYPVEILAHEIGHHVLAPATLNEHARMLARMRRALPTVENQAPMVANLYTDLLINDRLQRSANLRLADIYRALGKDGSSPGAVWGVYVRMYEILWSLPRGALKGGTLTDELEGDALLGARIVRSFAHDWLRGSGRFAALLLPHLLIDQESEKRIRQLMDTQYAGADGEPAGLTLEDPDEAGDNVHPAEDETPADEAPGPSPDPNGSQSGQAREPFQYGEILRASGLKITDHAAAVRYYRERARPHLIPFPSRPAPQAIDPLPEGLEPWAIGDALDATDWLQSILQSPHVVPGVTTVQRVWGTSPGHDPAREPLDLDLYVDCSGSMPNPQVRISYPTLAGSILCLSALRSGARVQATLWSGARQFQSTPGFVRDEEAIIGVLTGYLGGGTAFPIHVLRDTYVERPSNARAVHIVVISDDGVTTMFDADECGNSGWDVTAYALDKARGGGTLLLNLPGSIAQANRGNDPDVAKLKRAEKELGLNVQLVASWEDLVRFAREFSRQKFGAEAFTADPTKP
ncbi:MAG: VWA domain-containing protein [Opitutaceae bacterium]